MSKPKYAASTDANQKQILRQLNQIPGVQAIAIGEPVDLLIGYRSKNFLVELKDGNKKKYQHKYTPKQKQFLRDWTGQVRVAENFEEVLTLITDAYKK